MKHLDQPQQNKPYLTSLTSNKKLNKTQNRSKRKLFSHLFDTLFLAMQRSASSAKNMHRQILHHLSNDVGATGRRQPCDVFISHRGIDTKKNVAGLLFDDLYRLGHRPFLDSKNMKPGDKLFDKINMAIRECKVGVSVLSPRYCDSYFCLHELCLIMESKKRVIPVFVDVKPSELHVKVNGCYPTKDLERFRRALEEVKYTVGLSFNSSSENWSEFLMSASEAVMKNLLELEDQEPVDKVPQYYCISS